MYVLHIRLGIQIKKFGGWMKWSIYRLVQTEFDTFFSSLESYFDYVGE